MLEKALQTDALIVQSTGILFEKAERLTGTSNNFY